MNTNKKHFASYLGFSIALALPSISNANVALTPESSDWKASLSGSLPIFMVISDFDKGAEEKATRIMSGFNPVNLTFHVSAPEFNGITVSSHVQIDTHLQGSQTQNSGTFESRVAEVKISGDFGTLNVGKGFGIFNSSAIGDLGSGMGVGLLGGGADTGNATGGRIGTGYVYANFNPRIMYSSNDINGLTYKVGLFNPEEPTNAAGAVETALPRVEGQVNVAFTSKNTDIKLWTGFMWQEVELIVEDVDYDMRGIDIGAHLDIDLFGLTAAYTDTSGIGADGLYGFDAISDADVDGSQWYIEADIVVGKSTYGISYGEGDQDSHTSPFVVPEIKNELVMLFLRHKVTPNLTVMGELQKYESTTKTATTSITTTKYNAAALGFQFDF